MCATETSEQSEKVKTGRTRHAVQTVSEINATLQWKSTHKRGAETPEQREFKCGRNIEKNTWSTLPYSSLEPSTSVRVLPSSF